MWCRFALALLVILLQVTHTSNALSQSLKLQGGPVVIELDPVAVPVQQDISSRLRWNRVTAPSKIMVNSFSTEQRFNLFVEATNTRRGIPVGELQLIPGEPARDFVVGIGQRGAGQCTLNYRAETSAEQGFGTQIQTVTYTITGL